VIKREKSRRRGVVVVVQSAIFRGERKIARNYL
jgi:hypothetical protein